MKTKILIVDDEPNMRRGLRDNLLFEGFEVDEAADGGQALAKIEGNFYDLIILDVMMPVMGGFEVCKKVRQTGNNVPIVLLTAKGEEIDKVVGLELGADDYIQKPFSLRELIARVHAILRRSQSRDQRVSTIEIGKLTINLREYSAHNGNERVKLSHKEFEIIGYLYHHKNETVDRHELLQKVWGYDESPTTRTVDNFIVKLRQKIETDPSTPKYILTIHGVGYKLIVS